MTINELEINRLAEKFYSALRGFIVIEESGLPKYVEFLTEEKIDVILLSGLLTGLQGLAEVISSEKIKTIETSNSMLIFEVHDQYFYVIWIDKIISNIELYDDMIMKLISRFEGASVVDIDNALLISNLNETPDYEKFGRRLAKFKAIDSQYSQIYKNLLGQSQDSESIKRITEDLAGIDGVLIISDKDEIEHTEFSRGEPIFNIITLTNFLIGLRKSLKNLDPGTLEEITTQNYRFIVKDRQEYFYVFEVIKGLAKDEQLNPVINKLINRYEGLRKKNIPNIELLRDMESIPEHELLGQLSLEFRDRQSDNNSNSSALDRQTTRISFGDIETKWLREQAQLESFMDIFSDVFLVGIICPSNQFFIMKKVSDSNDWMNSANDLEIDELLSLTAEKQAELIRLAQGDKEFLVLRITNRSVLFSVVDKCNAALERYMLRMPNIIRKISPNIA